MTTKTLTAPDTGVFEDLVAGYDQTPACEGETHASGLAGHDATASAEYVMKWCCPLCLSHQTVLVCAARFHYMQEIWEFSPVVIMDCGHRPPVETSLVTVIKL